MNGHLFVSAFVQFDFIHLRFLSEWQCISFNKSARYQDASEVLYVS